MNAQPKILGNTSSIDKHNTYRNEDLSISDLVKAVTIGTLGKTDTGIAGSIAYLDQGARLYEAFITDASAGKDEPSASANVISIHKGSLANQMRDSQRLIVVGGGSKKSINNQELSLVRELFSKATKPQLSEIVLVDVSESFLTQQVEAIENISSSLGTNFNIRPIQAEFTSISDKFDGIMTNHFGSKPVRETRSALSMTGFTLTNVERVTSTEHFPSTPIEERMAHLSRFVNIGDTVLFDYSTDLNIDYYDTRSLAAFFNNVPVIMRDKCPNLTGLSTGDDYFRYRPKAFPAARLISHTLAAEAGQNARIENGVTRVFTIAVGDRLVLMYSARPTVSDIEGRPSENTGLESSMHVSSGKTVVHTFRKVGEPSILAL